MWAEESLEPVKRGDIICPICGDLYVTRRDDPTPTCEHVSEDLAEYGHLTKRDLGMYMERADTLRIENHALHMQVKVLREEADRRERNVEYLIMKVQELERQLKRARKGKGRVNEWLDKFGNRT